MFAALTILLNRKPPQALQLTESASIDIEGREIPVGVQREVLDAAGSRMSLGRGGTPEEAAGAVYLLCIPESDYITGHLLMCDGGR